MRSGCSHAITEPSVLYQEWFIAAVIQSQQQKLQNINYTIGSVYNKNSTLIQQNATTYRLKNGFIIILAITLTDLLR